MSTQIKTKEVRVERAEREDGSEGSRKMKIMSGSACSTFDFENNTEAIGSIWDWAKDEPNLAEIEAAYFEGKLDDLEAAVREWRENDANWDPDILGEIIGSGLEALGLLK